MAECDGPVRADALAKAERANKIYGYLWDLVCWAFVGVATFVFAYSIFFNALAFGILLGAAAVIFGIVMVIFHYDKIQNTIKCAEKEGVVDS